MWKRSEHQKIGCEILTVSSLRRCVLCRSIKQSRSINDRLKHQSFNLKRIITSICLDR